MKKRQKKAEKEEHNEGCRTDFGGKQNDPVLQGSCPYRYIHGKKIWG
jgi:hypothetical protein